MGHNRLDYFDVDDVTVPQHTHIIINTIISSPLFGFPEISKMFALSLNRSWLEIRSGTNKVDKRQNNGNLSKFLLNTLSILDILMCWEEYIEGKEFAGLIALHSQSHIMLWRSDHTTLMAVYSCSEQL